MFDTMTLTKLGGGFCGALLIFLLGKWAAETIYHSGGGHGYGDHSQAYVIDTGDSGEEAAEAEEGPSFAELFAAADTGKGERVFNKCKACHKLEQGANGTGPYLYGVVGRQVASAAGFGYSGNLAAVVDVWTPQELDAFLENPSGYAPGTTMAFAGLKKAEDRANVIAYLDQTDGDVYVIEEASAAEAVTAEEPAVAEVEPTPEAEAVAEAATEEPAAEEMASADTATEEPAAEEAAAEETTEEAATEEAAAAEEPAAEGSAFAALVAAANPEDGQKVYRKCAACHVLEDGKNRVGPYLLNVVGRDIGAAEGFRYSDALSGMDGVWTVDELSAFLENPKGYAPGNKMSFAGLKSEDDRAAVIAYIQSVSN